MCLACIFNTRTDRTVLRSRDHSCGKYIHAARSLCLPCCRWCIIGGGGGVGDVDVSDVGFVGLFLTIASHGVTDGVPNNNLSN